MNKNAFLKVFFIVATFFCMENARAQFGQAQWVRNAVGGTGNAIGTDAAHNVYVFGSYQYEMYVDTLHLIDSPIIYQNMFLTKYDANGKLQWVKKATSTGSCYGNAMSVDAAGNIYVGGNYLGDLNIGGQQLLANINTNIAPTAKNVFLAKFNTNGNVVWAKSVSGNDRVLISYGYSFGQQGGGMKIDKAGNLYITGWFGDFGLAADTVNFDNIQLTNDGHGSGFVAKFDTSGHVLWAKKIAGTCTPYDIAVNANDDLLVTGVIEDTMVLFDNIRLSVPFVRTKYIVSFLAKYDKNGNATWAKLIDGDDGVGSVSLATDKQNNVLITGFSFGDSVIFDNIVLPSNKAHNNGFIAKYSNGGNILWAKNMDPAIRSENLPNYLTIDANDMMYVVGNYKGTCSFDNKTISSVNNASYDVYVAKYDANGALQWLTGMGGKADDKGYCINVDNTGDVYVTGEIADTCTIGSFPVDVPYASMFVAKMTPPPTGVKQVTEMLNDISVYPNPTTSNVTINFGTGAFSTVRLADAIGRCVQTEIVNGRQQVSINTRGIGAGLYLITAQRSDGTMVSKKVIVER